MRGAKAEPWASPHGFVLHDSGQPVTPRRPLQLKHRRCVPQTTASLCRIAPVPPRLGQSSLAGSLGTLPTSIAHRVVGVAAFPGIMGKGRPCASRADDRSSTRRARCSRGRGDSVSSTALARACASSSASMPWPSSPGCVLWGSQQWGTRSRACLPGAAGLAGEGAGLEASHQPTTVCLPACLPACLRFDQTCTQQGAGGCSPGAYRSRYQYCFSAPGSAPGMGYPDGEAVAPSRAASGCMAAGSESRSEMSVLKCSA